MSGENNEHMVFIFWGGGGNSKTQFAKTINKLFSSIPASPKGRKMAGACHESLSTIKHRSIINLSLNTTANCHTSQLDSIVGTRFMFIDEVNDKRPIDISTLKYLLEGGAISHRPMYKREVTISNPSHTFILISSNLPYLPPDEAIKRHLFMYRFDTKFILSVRKGTLQTNMKRVSCHKAQDLQHQMSSSIETKGKELNALVSSVSFKSQLIRWLLRGAYLYYQESKVEVHDKVQMDTYNLYEFQDKFAKYAKDYLIYAPINYPLAKLYREGFCIKQDELIKTYKTYLLLVYSTTELQYYSNQAVVGVKFKG